MTVAANEQAVVDILLPQAAPGDYLWYKYQEANGWSECAPGFYPEAPEDGAVFDAARRTVTLTITDNGPLDDDDRQGIVRDPSGLGMPGDWHDGSSGGGCFINFLCEGDGNACFPLIFIKNWLKR
jgi:hypothetical protein